MADISIGTGYDTAGKNAGDEVITYCRGYAMEAERRIGQLLMETERATGAKGIGVNQYSKEVRSPEVTAPNPTLSDLGITKRESTQAQLMSSVPDEVFDAVKAGQKTMIKGQLVSRGVIGGTLGVPPITPAQTLSAMGLSKKESAQAQQLAALPDDDFTAIKKGQTTRGAVERMDRLGYERGVQSGPWGCRHRTASDSRRGGAWPVRHQYHWRPAGHPGGSIAELVQIADEARTPCPARSRQPPPPPRPKGMHWGTFRRLRAAHDAAVVEVLAG